MGSEDVSFNFPIEKGNRVSRGRGRHRETRPRKLPEKRKYEK